MTDLSALLDTDELRAEIVERATEKVLARWTPPKDDEARERFNAELADEVQRRFSDLLDAHLGPQVEAVIDAGLSEEYQPTDLYGTPKGDKQTLREAIASKIERAMTVRDNRPGYHSSDREKTALEKFVDEAVHKHVREQLWKEFQGIADEVTKAAATAIHDSVRYLVENRAKSIRRG